MYSTPEMIELEKDIARYGHKIASLWSWLKIMLVIGGAWSLFWLFYGLLSK